MSIDRAKEIYTEELNDRLNDSVDPLAYDIALELLMELPPDKIVELLVSYGYDQSPRDIAWHKFGDQAQDVVKDRFQ